MSLDDLPVVGQLLAVGTALLDLFANGGELVLALFTFLLGHMGLLFPFVTTLDKLAPRIGWVPPGVLDQVVTVVLVAMLATYLFRLVSNFRDTKS